LVAVLDGGETMLKVLSKKELEALLVVKTTVKQARQIIKRNKTVLNWIKKHPYEFKSFYLGCPHCVQSYYAVFNCSACEYTKAHNDIGSMPCIKMKFGGLVTVS
jgi:hypothetical protein